MAREGREVRRLGQRQEGSGREGKEVGRFGWMTRR
jgi:hypothetical protein